MLRMFIAGLSGTICAWLLMAIVASIVKALEQQEAQEHIAKSLLVKEEKERGTADVIATPDEMRDYRRPSQWGGNA